MFKIRGQGPIKSKRLPKDELKKIAAFFDGLEQDQADNLAAGLFGIYTPADATPEILDNVRSLWPDLWPLVSEDTRNEVGIKLARFTANADTDRAIRARELLDLVGGSSYLPEPERVAEIEQVLDDLKRAHEAHMRNYADRLYQDTKIKALTKAWLERNLRPKSPAQIAEVVCIPRDSPSKVNGECREVN
ncbi:hypothetical protein [Streptomyces sp. NPDC093149]|uniref:hypothetical protein n=1 Tax=Streptomyces sp. NPDC093149 TaxID=3366031 RepID=UPI0037FD843A